MGSLSEGDSQVRSSSNILSILQQLLPNLSYNHLKQLKKSINRTLAEKYPQSFGHGRRFDNPNRVPTDETVFKVLDAVRNEKARLALYCQAFLGLRIGDAVALQWKHFDFDKSFFFKMEEKTKRFVSKPIPSKLLELLLEYHKRHYKGIWLFPGLKQGHISATWVRNELRYTLDRLGLDNAYAQSADGRALREFSSHCLRRWYITKVAENAPNFFLATELAGHSSPKVTMQYYQGSELKKRNVIEKAFLV